MKTTLAGFLLLCAVAASAAETKKTPAVDGKVGVVFTVPRLPVKKGRAPRPRIIRARAGRGATVHTGKSTAVIPLGRNAVLRLRKDTVIRFKKLRLDPKTQRLQAYIEVLKGKILFKVKKLKATRSHLTIRTPTCVAAVRGTIFVIDASAPKRTTVEVLEGKLDTYSTKGLAAGQDPPEDAAPIAIEAGKELSFADDEEPGKPHEIEPAELAEDQAWIHESEASSSLEKDEPAGDKNRENDKDDGTMEAPKIESQPLEKESPAQEAPAENKSPANSETSSDIEAEQPGVSEPETPEPPDPPELPDNSDGESGE